MTVHVTGGRCTACGTVSYPHRAVCPNCRGETFEEVSIAGRGTVLSYTDVYALAIDYETRYLRLAIVELDDGQRVTGQLLDDSPALGKPVRTTVGVVRRQGETTYYGFQFVPI